MSSFARQALLWASVAALAVPTGMHAQFILSTNDGQISIAGYTGAGGTVTIPSTTNRLPVTSIGSRAFMECTSLASVTIPGGVTNIGDGTFLDCASLTAVTIPSNVTSIGRGAFSGCTSLTGITVAELNPAYSSVGGVLLNKSQTTLICYPGGRAPSSYAIPSSVTSIGDSVFTYCTRLTSVTIPQSVTNIGQAAFRYCTSLTNVTIPNSVIGIGRSAFMFCSSLTNVTIPSSVTNIGRGAFTDCSNLTSITVAELNPTYSTMGGVLFDKSQTTLICYPGSRATSSYAIPSSVTSIGIDTFQNCNSLTNVTIGTNVTSIGNSAFSECTRLASVTIPGSVTNIGRGAFENCTRLRSVYLKGNAPHVEDDVFSGARKATIYHLPNTTGWGTTFGGRPTAIWKPQTNPERGRRRVRFRKNANPMQKLPRKNCRKAVCL